MKLFWLCVILLIEERIMMLGYILVEDIFDEIRTYLERLIDDK